MGSRINPADFTRDVRDASRLETASTEHSPVFQRRVWGISSMPYYRLFYHFVWTTKQRQPLITERNQGAIYATIRAKTELLHGIVYALNGVADHVHLMVSLPPSLAPATFIGQIKGSSSRAASQLDGSFAWQNEYAVLSVSESHLPTVVRYVDGQQAHHADQTLNAKLEPNW